jgi:glycosyltransferase involved in cell wall biosynthesis
VQAMGGDTLKWMVLSKLIFGWKANTVFYNGSLVSKYFKSALIRRFNKMLYRSLDGVVSVSEASKLDFEKIASFSGLHRGIPVGVKAPQVTVKGLGHSFQTLVHVGGFTFEKNHEGLFRIFKKILNQKPETKLILIGDGPLRKEMEESVNRMEISNLVSFLGAKTEPFQLVPADSLLLLPSLIEGLPAVILEAFYSGIPVLAYAVGGVGEVLKKGETGFPIPAGDEDSFVKEALAIMEMSPFELHPLLRNARKLVESDFSMSSVSKKYEGFYFELCESSK